MTVYSGNELSTALRRLCDGIEHRLWIASPYIGAWQNVRSILGRSWWDNGNVKVRLLTDEEENPDSDTLRRFNQRGTIHHLRGLHAKIYIVDDQVLLTSANLTGTAFSKRHEVGTILKGDHAQLAIATYENWFNSPLARPLDYETLKAVLSKKRSQSGEDSGSGLPALISLPPDPGDFGNSKFENLFLDYQRFLEAYQTLTETYLSAQQRLWPSVPIYLEVDGFLDFLFRWQEDRVSRLFEEKPFRKLTQSERKVEVANYAKQFATWANNNNEDGQWRFEHSKSVRALLSSDRIGELSRADIRKVAEGLNCMNDRRQLNKFLNPEKNTTVVIRRAWQILLHGTRPLTERMSICASDLYSFKRSSVQELLGFFAPDQYPLRNLTVNAGLRFLGFDISAD